MSKSKLGNRYPWICKAFKQFIVFIFILACFINYQILRHATSETALPISTNSDKNSLEHFKTSFTNPKPFIRSWGCALKEIPFIFVHIGKAGGGTARARIAASALNYTSGPRGWKTDVGAYYPIRDEEGNTLYKARFCNSMHRQFRPVPQQALEMSTVCHASTPIGQALACPEPIHISNRYYLTRNGHNRSMHCIVDFSSSDAPQIYAGHNFLGTELHWLPPRFFSRWWKEHWHTSSMEDMIEPLWEGLNPNLSNGSILWCNNTLARPTHPKDFTTNFNCHKVMYPMIDQAATKIIEHKLQEKGDYPKDVIWGHVYASLPVTRATQVREPFSWILSKYFWHEMYKNHHCSNISAASGIDYPVHKKIDFSASAAEKGWVRKMCLLYLYSICGEDCMVRHNKGESSLAQLEKQAEFNLRNSFAVVGLADEPDVFLKMLDDRVDYFDMNLNPSVVGNKHRSVSGIQPDVIQECKNSYLNNSDFRALLKQACPELALLERLFKVALEVNRFQLEELSMCDPSLVE